jgi:hypothetical protein
MSDEADHGVAPLVYRVACVLARAAGRLDTGEPENWANYSNDATLVLEAIYTPRHDMELAGGEVKTYSSRAHPAFKTLSVCPDVAGEVWREMLRVGAWIEEASPK